MVLKMYPPVFCITVILCALFPLQGQESDNEMDEAAEDAIEAVLEAEEEAGEAVLEEQEYEEEVLRERKVVARAMVHECCEERRRCRISGSGGFAPQVIRLSRDFLEKVRKYENDLVLRDFPFENNSIFMLGFNGYAQLDNGFRSGGGLWAGYKHYDSDEFIHTLTDSTGDTTHRYNAITTLRVIPAYGGFTAEKAFSFYPWTVNVGGMIGGGAYIFHKQIRKFDDIFASVDEDSLDWTKKNNSVAVAPFIAWDLHTGIMVELAPLFKLGVDGILLFTYSPNGFVTGTGFGDFMLVSPGIRLKFIFGKDYCD
ncbi:MAG: hypothetical protein GF401_02935 [Chitinivibrionales bacterium]|nr:hypothetical protein [Chitinivibrionales bacterium]